MADIVSKKNNDNFAHKAKLHRQIASHTLQMLSQYKVLQDHMIEAIQSSSFTEVLPRYMAWWEPFHTHAIKYAELHEKIADNLDKTPVRFDETDKDIKQPFDADAASSS